MPALGPTVLALSLGLLLAACGDAGGEGACGPILREDLDPASGAHVLPTAADVEYTTDPPTSGPHRPGPSVEPLPAEPLPGPVQVGILEAGGVLVQHDGLAADQIAELEGLASERVVVAPGDGLPSPVVATAWTAKRTCSSVDLTALEEFVDERGGRGPGSDG